jgi:phenylacetate-CoA ligase
LRLVQDRAYQKWSAAANYYYYGDMLHVEEPTAKKVILWGSERDLMKGSVGPKCQLINWISNTVFCNSFRMSPADMENYIARINHWKPELVRGYAGALYDLCSYAALNGIAVVRPKAVISSAERLDESMRNCIEEVFGCKVYDFYGSREASTLAGECSHGLLHMFMPNHYIEVVGPDNTPVAEGEEGRILVTTLHNFSMPLIRYEIGDTAVLGPRVCPCGNPLPTLRRLNGRITEHLVKRDGTLVSGAALTLTFNLKDWVKSFQVLQEDYDSVRILVVRRGEPNHVDMAEAEHRFHVLMGDNCRVSWDFVDEIPVTASGKHLYIRSLVAGKS